MISLIITLVTLFFMGKTFEKMGRSFWQGFIPIYNLYILLEVFGKPLWWLILLFIPVANIIILFLIFKELAERFGKDYLMAIVMTVLPFVGFAILALTDCTYTKK